MKEVRKKAKENSNAASIIKNVEIKKIADELLKEEDSIYIVSSRMLVNYASKEGLLKRILVESNDGMTLEIIERLKKEKITEEEANTLLGAKSWIIRDYAVGYASKEKVLESAASEKNRYVAESIIERLKKEKLTEEKANTLLRAKFWEIRDYAVGYASKEKVLKAAVLEKNIIILKSILKRLEEEKLTEEEANTLLGAKYWELRDYAVGYASKEKVLKAAVLEENIIILKSILKRLEEEKLTEEEVNTLLATKSLKIRSYAVKYTTKEKVIETAVSEEYYDVIERIIERLGKEKITQKEANTLLAAKSWVIIEFAVKHTTKEKVLQMAVSEEHYYVTKSIVERLEKEEITKEEANTLLAAKSSVIRNYAVKYASKEQVLKEAASEEKDNVAESIIEKLEKEKITEDEANTLLEAEYWKIRNYAVKYASKEILLEAAVSEGNNVVVDSIFEKLIKEGITKEEVKKLTKSYNDCIRNFAKAIFKKI